MVFQNIKYRSLLEEYIFRKTQYSLLSPITRNGAVPSLALLNTKYTLVLILFIPKEDLVSIWIPPPQHSGSDLRHKSILVIVSEKLYCTKEMFFQSFAVLFLGM